MYQLNISVFVTETETPETANAFDDVMLEMEGKKSFYCNVCSKVCKSKGGLIRHHNSKKVKIHRRQAATKISQVWLLMKVL